MVYFFWYFERKIVTFEKSFRGNVKIAFNMSRGPSWWNYFSSLKTFFPQNFQALSKKVFANFLRRFLETTSYVPGGPFAFFSDFVISYLIFFGIWAGNFRKVLMNFFRQVCKKCILKVRRKVLKEYTSFAETCYVFSFSKTLSEIFGNFHKKLTWF